MIRAETYEENACGVDGHCRSGGTRICRRRQFLPDWLKVLNAARNTKTKVLREKPAAIELSKYALPPGTSVEAKQVSCPSFATGFALHDYRAYGSDGSSTQVRR